MKFDMTSVPISDMTSNMTPSLTLDMTYDLISKMTNRASDITSYMQTNCMQNES